MPLEVDVYQGSKKIGKVPLEVAREVAKKGPSVATKVKVGIDEFFLSRFDGPEEKPSRLNVQ